MEKKFKQKLGSKHVKNDWNYHKMLNRKHKYVYTSWKCRQWWPCWDLIADRAPILKEIIIQQRIADTLCFLCQPPACNDQNNGRNYLSPTQRRLLTAINSVRTWSVDSKADSGEVSRESTDGALEGGGLGTGQLGEYWRGAGGRKRCSVIIISFKRITLNKFKKNAWIAYILNTFADFSKPLSYR